MLPELTEFVPATRMRIVRKVLLSLKNRAGYIFSLLQLCTGLDNISKYYSCTMKTQGSHPVSNFEAKAPFKSIEKK
jgi:hypothetical protein